MNRNAIVLVALMLAGLATTGSAQQTPADRSGFTMLLNIGVGFQHDEFVGSTETGVEGINLGLGGFLSENLALMFRVSGTSVSYADTWQTSGTGGATLQYWVSDRLHLEGGAGIGFWRFDDVDDTGLGLIVGAGYSIWSDDSNNLYLGVEYAPAFTDPDMVHNFGVVFGWQLL